MLTAKPTPDILRARWEEIVRQAVQECRTQELARNFLDTPRVRWQGKTALEMMTSEAGCDEVMRLLSELNI